MWGRHERVQCHPVIPVSCHKGSGIGCSSYCNKGEPKVCTIILIGNGKVCTTDCPVCQSGCEEMAKSNAARWSSELKACFILRYYNPAFQGSE